MVAAMVLTALRQLAERRLHRSYAVVVARQRAVVAELQAVAAVVEEPVARCLMYLEPTRPDQLLDQCCAAMQPSVGSSR